MPLKVTTQSNPNGPSWRRPGDTWTQLALLANIMTHTTLKAICQ